MSFKAFIKKLCFWRKKKVEAKPQLTFLLRDALEKNKPRVKTLVDKYIDNILKLAASSGMTGMTIDEASRVLATASQIPLPPEQMLNCHWEEQPSVESESTYVNDTDGFRELLAQRPIPNRRLEIIRRMPHGIDRKVCAHVDSRGNQCSNLVDDEAYSFCKIHRHHAMRNEEQREIDRQLKEREQEQKKKHKLSNGKRRKIIRRKK